MPKSFAVVGLLLALFFVGPLAVYAQEGAWRFGAVQIISGIELDAQPVIAATPEGEIVVAWAQAASQGKGATIYAAKGPRKWSPRPIADLALTDDVLTLYLSTDIKGRPHLAWSYPLTDTFVLAEWGLEDGQPIRERTIERIGRMAFALDASDGLYYMRSTDRAVTYHGPREEFTATLELAEGDLVRETSLGVGPKGQGYLTWTTVNQASGASAVFGAQAISGTLPIHLGSGRAPHIVVSPGGRAHLLWRHEDALYYANSVDWSRLYVLDTGLSTDDVHTLIVGPDEVAHAFWVHEGALWHATSLDWRLTKNMITAPVEVEHLAATVDGAGQSHIVWSAKGGEGGHTLYYLNPKPISPQLAVTYPLAGALLGPKTLAQAVSNLPPAELLRVEFYLQAQNQLVAGDDDALLALGVDDDGSDGWAVPLDGDRLYPTDRYRVIALATDRDGNTLQAVGEWFEAHSRQEAGLFLRAEGPQPLRQWASLSLIGRMPAEASTQLDLFFLPTECTASEPVRRGAFPLTEQARYLGVYELRPAGDGFIQQSLSFDSRRLPDGCYVPFALFRDGAMRYVYGDNTKPLRVENASPPTVHILSPLPGQLIRETLEILVDAEDADGLVKRVDFYLQRELGPLRPPQRLWLGCDDKAEEGWRLAVTIDEPLDGENWQILVTAIDDDRLTSAPAIIGPIDLVGRQRPQLSILRPTAGRPLYDVESVRVFVLQGGEYIEGIDLYAQEADGPLRPVGAMERVDAAWECPWDTRQWPDGTYRLYALARHTDGRRTLVSTPGLTVLNQAPIAGIVQPRAGELLAGWTLVRVQGGGASAPIAALRFYCRDAQGELYRIGEDLSADNGWA
ncbi:MAG: hypothetical protein H5T69_12210, partial [Chloroflexi bacterium]|nr:hypothetical protein [Chloroflexota bacterium]